MLVARPGIDSSPLPPSLFASGSGLHRSLARPSPVLYVGNFTDGGQLHNSTVSGGKAYRRMCLSIRRRGIDRAARARGAIRQLRQARAEDLVSYVFTGYIFAFGKVFSAR
jgi:hypothetical protein